MKLLMILTLFMFGCNSPVEHSHGDEHTHDNKKDGFCVALNLDDTWTCYKNRTETNCTLLNAEVDVDFPVWIRFDDTSYTQGEGGITSNEACEEFCEEKGDDCTIIPSD